jgi:NIMA (never in mitosis gene a)-related kinase 2
MEYCERGDMA